MGSIHSGSIGAIGWSDICSRGVYKAILVQKDTYLLELTRYVVLNPIRARMVADPAEWPWSSYQLSGRRRRGARSPLARYRLAAWPVWPAANAGDRRLSPIRFGGQGRAEPLESGSAPNAVGRRRVRGPAPTKPGARYSAEVSKAQRRSVALNLPVYQGRYPDRPEAMARAYFSGPILWPRSARISPFIT
jgi:hypothetical protein